MEEMACAEVASTEHSDGKVAEKDLTEIERAPTDASRREVGNEKGETWRC